MQPNEPQQPSQPPVPQASGAQTEVPAPQFVAPVEQPAPMLPQAEPVLASEQVLSPESQLENVQQVSADETTSEQPSELPEIMPVTWQSNEYAQHDKSPLWYVGLVVIVVVLMGIAIWLGAWSFAALIPVMVVALMVYTHRPPQVINYAVSEQGLFINDMLHPMGEFKAFAVGHEMAQNSLSLVPVKRFRPAIKMFFPQEVGEQLVDTIGAYLPSQDYRVDIFDKIIQKLRI